jgi:hypothetical protein
MTGGYRTGKFLERQRVFCLRSDLAKGGALRICRKFDIHSLLQAGHSGFETKHLLSGMPGTSCRHAALACGAICGAKLTAFA